MRGFAAGFVLGFFGKVDELRGPLSRRAFLVASAPWWAFVVSVFVAVLHAAPAHAQGAGQAAPPGSSCGPGQTCRVATLRTTSTSRVAACFRGGTYPMGITSSGGANVVQFYTDNECTSLAAGGLTFVPSGGYVSAALSVLSSGYVNAATGFCSGATACSGTAFASFPACAAGTAGRLLYDSTNGFWRRCLNGTGWVAIPLAFVDNVVSFAPSGVTAGYAFAQWSVGGMFGAGANSSVNVGGQVAVVGVGAGDVTYTLYNETTGTSLGATVTCPCSGSTGTCTSIGGVPVTVTNDNVVHGWRLTTACAGTNPQVNLDWTITHKDT